MDGLRRQQGAQFAFDPEIPSQNQRVLFQGNSLSGKWKLNGKELSPRELSDGFYPEKKGKYRLELFDEENQKRDEVSFYVKGGSSKN